MSRVRLILILIFAAGALVRVADTFRPINQASWRECDEGSVSRNYAEESMNLFYPRIDWRGNSLGYAEMEFPAYPYLIAISYKLFGFHDYFGRIWSLLFSFGTMFFFYKLARLYLDDLGLVFAVAFFAFNPLIVEFSTAIQPEGFMLLCYTAGVYFFVSWIKSDKDRDFWLAVGATALTLLAKATAAHIGLVFGVLLLQKYGPQQFFRQTRVWIFGAVTLIPAILWYAHAKILWKDYGNSLGVSNEYHWIGPDFFTNPYFIKGIVYSEFSAVWVSFGIVIGAFALWQGFGEKVINFCLLWTAAIFAMYIIAARTTADDWAVYYHIFAVLPAALVIGFGTQRFWGYLQSLTNYFTEIAVLPRIARVIVCAVFSIALLGTFLLEAKQIRANLLEHRTADESLSAAREIKPQLNKDGLILVSGGSCFDTDGYPVAYNASPMFYWLERKGFNICVEDQSLSKVNEFAGKGAVYFVAQKNMIGKVEDFDRGLRRNFTVVADTNMYTVFDLETRP